MKFLTPAEFRIYLRHAAVAAIRLGLVALFLIDAGLLIAVLKSLFQ
jgi:hypothetical protein